MQSMMSISQLSTVLVVSGSYTSRATVSSQVATAAHAWLLVANCLCSCASEF